MNACPRIPEAFAPYAPLGGKAGFFFYLQQFEDMRPFLPREGIYLPPGESFESIEPELKEIMGHYGQLIVRACNLHDITGFVDVVPTKITSGSEIESVQSEVEAIRHAASHPDVASFYRYETGRTVEDLSREIGILIQECVEYDDLVSMVEHPHQKGLFLIERKNVLSRFSNIKLSLCREEGTESDIRNFSHISPLSNANRQLISLYRSVEEKGVVDAAFSMHLEVGEKRSIGGSACQHTLFQVRSFREHEPQASFDGFHVYFSYLNFGITPPEGIKVWILPIDLNRRSFPSIPNFSQMAYSFDSFDRKPPSLTIQPTDMVLYIAMQYAVLSHGHFRFFQRTPFCTYNANRFQYNFSENPIEATYYSNGMDAGFSYRDR